MKRLLVAAALIAGVGITTVGTADAGESTSLAITYSFFGSDGNTVSDNASGQLFSDGIDVTDDADCVKVNDVPDSSSFTVDCDVDDGVTYTVGVDNIGDYYVADAWCDIFEPDINRNRAIEDPDATFTQPDFGFTRCYVDLAPKPMLYLDKVVEGGGPLGSSDFPLEIYQDGVKIADAVDPDPALCVFEDEPVAGDRAGTANRVADANLCAAIRLEPGTYNIGEVLPDYGYVERDLDCSFQFDGEILQQQKSLPSPEFDVDHSLRGAGEEFKTEPEETLCVLTNDYVEGTVTADLVVINDDGGTATASQFTIEVFDSSGTVYEDGVDPDPALGNALVTFELPIGDYTFGVTGPEGYTSSATVTVTPDAARAITGADFTAAAGQTVAGVITVDDPPPAATTTTTSTTTTTTVVPATAPAPTAGPTTTITMLLPETGSNDGQTSTLVLMAIGSLILGAGAVLATRRS